MTIQEVINKIDGLRPNSYTDEQKIDWLSDLDGKVFEDIYLTHEGNERWYRKYSIDDTDKKLLIPDRFSDIYLHWLSAQIYYYNNEIARYSNAMVMYNNSLSDLKMWYNRTHKPINKTKIKNY